MDNNLYFVSRQHYWGVSDDDGETPYMVEIAIGGGDYSNPDMLGTQYPLLGEGQEFYNPVEAASAAIRVYQAWKSDHPELPIGIDYGFTGGMTMPFEGSNEAQVMEWAQKRLESLPKCDQCGVCLPKEYYTLNDYGDDCKYCSEYCADRAYIAMQEDEEESHA